jgi:ribosomal protein S24E
MVCRLVILPANSVMEGHIGYRRQNNILLRKDVFDEFIWYCRNDNFPEMRKIIEHLIDLENNELEWVKQDKEKQTLGLEI